MALVVKAVMMIVMMLCFDNHLELVLLVFVLDTQEATANCAKKEQHNIQECQ